MLPNTETGLPSTDTGLPSTETDLSTLGESVRNRKIAVLISGGGTTLQNLIHYQRQHPHAFEISLVVSSSSQAGGLQFADQARIPSCVTLFGKSSETTGAAAKDIFDKCRQANIQLVVLAGFLKHLLIAQDFENRVINIHPSLIPAFCGHGYYGKRVHEAVLEYGCHVSGCTVHFVDNEFDHGPIIAQRVVAVRSDDTPGSLQQKVFAEECQIYPRVIEAYFDKRLRQNKRRFEIVAGL